MSVGAPGDVTIGEVWRGVTEVRSELSSLNQELRALPHTLASELDTRTAGRVEALKVEIALQIAPLELRVSRLERVMWAVIAFVFVTNGAAIFALILRQH